MEEGFIPDFAHAEVLQNYWIKGAPHENKIFGVKTGGIRANRKKGMPITTYRCPSCNLLEFYTKP